MLLIIESFLLLLGHSNCNKMSKHQFLIDELTDSDRDQESKITLREEKSAEKLESEFLVKKELVENGTYEETTIFPSQDDSVDMPYPRH